MPRLIKPRRPRLLLGTLAATLLLTGAVLAVLQTSAGERLEQRTVDARFAERGRLPAPNDIVVVAIDKHQSTYNNQWPISRDLWAMAINQLDNAGVAGIAVDVPMEWKATNPTEDATFAKAVADAHVPVVLARRSAHDRAGAAMGDVIEVPAATHGVSARIPAADGAVRRYPVRSRWNGTRMDGLAAALLRATGAGNAVERAPDDMLLNYYGPRGTFEQVGFADVAYGLSGMRDLAGKLVLIGPTEDIGRDDHDVPVGSAMPSVEIQAQATANLLDGSWLRELPTWVGWATAFAIAVAIWALLLTLPLLLAVPASIALVAGWGYAATQLFDRGLVVPVVAPMLAGAVVFTTLALTLVTLAVRERIRVKGLFARYVHADVVRELIDGEDQISLTGEEREITVLFSDIRGFTTLSEQVEPAAMVAQLNEYFEAMVDVVTEHDGAVDKFLGDGLMAIFGAPVRCEAHAERASAAALAMVDRLELVNADRARRGLAPLRIGIGLHTGRAVVGNVGSPPFRVDFTAIGDTVNLTARLEAMTKELGVTIVASGATADAVDASHGTGNDPLTFTALGTVVARGRTEPTHVFELSRRAVSTTQRDAA